MIGEVLKKETETFVKKAECFHIEIFNYTYKVLSSSEISFEKLGRIVFDVVRSFASKRKTFLV